jgi:AcrR family transcriptional regulator
MLTQPGRREQTKAANRAAILAAGRAVFGELGYGASSVRDIIRRTDLAAGTFYNYFPDKESIFRALVDEIGAEARRRVRAARRAAASPVAFVEDGYRAYFSYIVSEPEIQAFISRNAGTIRAMFEDGQLPMGTDELIEDIQRIELPNIDVQYLAHTMMAIGLELGERLLERDPPDVEGATHFAAGMVLGGISRLA